MFSMQSVWFLIIEITTWIHSVCRYSSCSKIEAFYNFHYNIVKVLLYEEWVWGIGEERVWFSWQTKIKFTVSTLELKVNYINLRKTRGRFHNSTKQLNSVLLEWLLFKRFTTIVYLFLQTKQYVTALFSLISMTYKTFNTVSSID